MNKISFFLFALTSLISYSQNTNFLLGKVYYRNLMNENSFIQLHFNNQNSGYSYSESNSIEIEVNFTYQINGNNVVLRYDKGLGTEEYFINQATDELRSNNEGYVNGVWGKIVYRRKQGAGTPGMSEGASYSWNQEKSGAQGRIQIGNQIWASENLNVTVFNNGDAIPEAKTDEEWEGYINEKKPAWCYYNNDSTNELKYGKLYNYYALIDPRGLAPKGWRIPTIKDWDKLISPYGGRSLYSRAANYLKKRDAWAKSDISEETQYSNTSGFSAIPAGYRQSNGVFLYESYWGIWWNQDGSNTLIRHDSHILGAANFQGKLPGLSIRLIKDYEEYEKVQYLRFTSSKVVVVDTKSEPTLQGTINKIEIKANEDSEVVFNNDENRTATYKLSRNNIQVVNINGNWTINNKLDGSTEIFLTYNVAEKRGYETSYINKKILFNVVFDEDKEMKSVSSGKDVFLRENYEYNKSIYRAKKAEEAKLLRERLEFENRFDIAPLDIIGKSYKIDELEVSEYFYSSGSLDKVSYEDALKLCELLGAGWRLPNSCELMMMTRNSIGIITRENEASNFNEYIWCSDSDTMYPGITYAFKNGIKELTNKSEKCNVRFVKGSEIYCKTQSMMNYELIGEPIAIGRINVSNSEVDFLLSYSEAELFCSKLGPGWRIPTKKEMKLISENKQDINLVDGCYWTSSFSDKSIGTRYTLNTNNSGSTFIPKQPNNYFLVRPVKTID